MSKLLIDERPLTVLPSLVKLFGMERAVILQQIHWLLLSKSSGADHEGHKWVWGSHEEWCAEYFPFWEADTLRKHLKKLEQDGFVISIQIKGFDRTKHYRLNYENIELAIRHDHAGSKRNDSSSPNRHDHAGSIRHRKPASMRDDRDALIRHEDDGSFIKTSTETSIEKKKEEEEKASGPADEIESAWTETYGDAIPGNLLQPLSKLLTECGPAAVVHGIRASTGAESRSFKYIAKCAHNYIPPAPEQASRPSYAVDLPGVYQMPALAAPAEPAKPLPPPMAHDDPWAVCLAELQGSLPGVALGYLAGSRLVADGEVDGVPLYRVVCDERATVGLSWLTAQAGPAIRRKVSGVLRKSVLVEIVVGDMVGV